MELPPSIPSIFATSDEPTPLLTATSALLTGAITVFLFRSLCRPRQARQRNILEIESRLLVRVHFSIDGCIYDFLSATWWHGGDMPGNRRLLFVCVSGSNRMVFVVGGHCSDKCALKLTMAYDVANDERTCMSFTAGKYDESKGAYHCGKFHVIDGYPKNT